MKSRLGALFIAVLMGLAVLWAPSAASAHSGFSTYLYLDVSPAALGGRLEIPIRDLAAILDESFDGSEAEVAAQLEAASGRIAAYLAQHVALGHDGQTWPLTFETPTLFFSDLPEQDSNYVIVPLVADLGGADLPRRFDVMLDPFFDEIPGRDALLLIANDYEGGVIENGHEILMAFTGDVRTQELDLGSTGWTKTFGASVKLGVNHIRYGPDHVLFVCVLLLPAVLVFTTAASWKPAPEFRSALWRVAKVVTMFTVAHTITFSLAALDILPLPPDRVTESIIAASIGLAALHNLKPVAVNREWMIAFVFGLFHGMGFAGLVGGLEVGRGTQLLSLLGRNIGIELAQTAIVLAVFPALYLLRRTRYYKSAMYLGSVALAAISFGWLIERLFEVDLSVNRFVDPLVVWPRSFVLIMVGTVAAAGVYAVEQRAGRLLAAHRAEPETPAFSAGV